MKLAEITTHSRDTDAYTLLPHAGHVLWETTQMLHCSCAAAWRQYLAVLEAVPAEDWLRDSTGTMLLWSDCTGWQVFRDAVNRLYLELRQRDIPSNGATLSPPVIQRRSVDTEVPFLRAKAPLCAYVRIDFEGPPCTLEFETGEAIPLLPGALFLVSGFRRHRLRGAGHFLHFQAQIPAVARTEALQTRPLHDAAVPDFTVFAAATALPLSEPLAPLAGLTEKINWLQARHRRRHRYADCPAVRKFLLNNEDPGSATAEELGLIARHSANGKHASALGDQATVLESIPVLDHAQCQTLRQFAEDHMTSAVPDSVDDLPEYQVNLSYDLLEQLLGNEATQKLWNLPERLRSDAKHVSHDRNSNRQVDVFIRMYAPDMRPYIPFHSDSCAITANVALNDGREFKGGSLLAMTGHQLHIVPREIGVAAVHCSHLVHGVSKIETGVRYTLILFYHSAAVASPAA